LVEFSQQLATCLASGIAIVEALSMMQSHSHYVEYQMMAYLIRQIKTGTSLSNAMETDAHFPIFMAQMIKMGESTGELEKMLFYVAEYYQADLESTFNKLQTLIEPLIISMLGVLIGCLVVGIYLPIFKMGNMW
jgi:type IV pilus assembly protein PilC